MPSGTASRSTTPTFRAVEAAGFGRAADLDRKRENAAARGVRMCQWPQGCITRLHWDNENGLCGSHMAMWRSDPKRWNEAPPSPKSPLKRQADEEYVYLDGLASVLERAIDRDTGKRWTLKKLGHAVGLYEERYRYITCYARTDREKGGRRCQKTMAERLARTLGVGYEDLKPREA